jgi:DhnA family fructose-bisphosphate aldolase class Ia
MQLPGRPEIRERCIDTIMALRRDCTTYGMPLMIEALVMRDNTEGGAYMVDGDTDKIVALVRQARELGADVIKADPTDNTGEFHRVIETAGGIPVLVRGGGRVSDSELLSRTENLLAQGADGIVYGRNIIQHPRPVAITRALMAMLHQGADADAARAQLDTTAP